MVSAAFSEILKVVQVWVQHTQNAYGAFAHVAMQSGLLRAIEMCGPMLAASIIIQVCCNWQVIFACTCVCACAGVCVFSLCVPLSFVCYRQRKFNIAAHAARDSKPSIIPAELQLGLIPCTDVTLVRVPRILPIFDAALPFLVTVPNSGRLLSTTSQLPLE